MIAAHNLGTGAQASRVPHEAATQPNVLWALAISIVRKLLMPQPRVLNLGITRRSAFIPIPIFTGVIAHVLELLNVVSKGVTKVLRPVVAPTSVFVEFVANILRRGESIFHTFLWIFTTVGVVSAGLGKGEEQEEDQRGLHFGIVVR